MVYSQSTSTDLALVLISREGVDRRFLEEVASGAHRSVQIFETAEQARAQLNKEGGLGDFNIFVDVSGKGYLEEFESCFGALLGEGAGQISSDRVHFICTDSLSGVEAIVGRSSSFGNFIPRRFGVLEESGRHYGKILANLRRGDGLGFPYSKSIELRKSSQKAAVLVEAEEFLRTKTELMERIIPQILTGLDEIIMNAIYDAPIDTTTGEQLLKHVMRDTEVEIPAGGVVKVQFGYDGEYAAFSVTDSFGSLKKYNLLRHLVSDPTTETLVVNSTGAGAGIGLATTFLKGGSLHFLCEPGVRTEATVLYRQTKNFREFKEQFRFLSVHFTRKS
jgi:hypothetical protein